MGYPYTNFCLCAFLGPEKKENPSVDRLLTAHRHSLSMMRSTQPCRKMLSLLRYSTQTLSPKTETHETLSLEL